MLQLLLLLFGHLFPPLPPELLAVLPGWNKSVPLGITWSKSSLILESI